MEIVIRRIHKSEVSIDGYLSINNERICDTAESRSRLLPVGVYPIMLVKCKQYGRRCICVAKNYTGGLTPCVVLPDCEKCTQLNTEYVNNNTVMPQACPMLKMGNGVIARPDGSIILGERVGSSVSTDERAAEQPYVPVWGSMIHTRAAYDRVFDRVRKALERGHKVTLRIM